MPGLRGPLPTLGRGVGSLAHPEVGGSPVHPGGFRTVRPSPVAAEPVGRGARELPVSPPPRAREDPRVAPRPSPRAVPAGTGQSPPTPRARCPGGSVRLHRLQAPVSPPPSPGGTQVSGHRPRAPGIRVSPLSSPRGRRFPRAFRNFGVTRAGDVCPGVSQQNSGVTLTEGTQVSEGTRIWVPPLSLPREQVSQGTVKFVCHPCPRGHSVLGYPGISVSPLPRGHGCPWTAWKSAVTPAQGDTVVPGHPKILLLPSPEGTQVF